MSQSPFTFEQHILIRSESADGFSIKEWVRAFTVAGLRHGDGDLFWMLNHGTPSGDEPDELFCAEPFSQLGYFHPLDWDNEVATLPDVSLHFKVSDFKKPVEVLQQMHAAAQKIGEALKVLPLDAEGEVFDLHKAIQKVEGVHNEILLKRIFGES